MKDYEEKIKARLNDDKMKELVTRHTVTPDDPDTGFACIRMPDLLKDMADESHSAITEAGGTEQEADEIVSIMLGGAVRKLFYGIRPNEKLTGGVPR